MERRRVAHRGRGATQQRVGGGEDAVGGPQHPAGRTGGVRVDQVAHDGQRDVGRGLRADRDAQAGAQQEGVADQEAEAAARAQEGVEPLTDLAVVLGRGGGGGIDEEVGGEDARLEAVVDPLAVHGLMSPAASPIATHQVPCRRSAHRQRQASGRSSG